MVGLDFQTKPTQHIKQEKQILKQEKMNIKTRKMNIQTRKTNIYTRKTNYRAVDCKLMCDLHTNIASQIYS
jgi:hypothetical protein